MNKTSEISDNNECNTSEIDFNSLLAKTDLLRLNTLLIQELPAREGYKFENNQLLAPLVFCKISNNFDHSLHENEKTVIYDDDNIIGFHGDYTVSHTMEGFNEKVSNLNESLKKRFLEKIEHFMRHYDDYLIDKKFLLSGERVLKSACNINIKVFELFDHCEGIKDVPKLIFDLKTRILKVEELISLFYLHLVGYDILIINRKGHVDIEDLIKTHYFTIHQGLIKKDLTKKNKFVTPLILIILIAIILVIGNGIYHLTKEITRSFESASIKEFKIYNLFSSEDTEDDTDNQNLVEE